MNKNNFRNLAIKTPVLNVQFARVRRVRLKSIVNFLGVFYSANNNMASRTTRTTRTQNATGNL